MTDTILDRLLVTLDVAVDALAVCEVAKGKRLVGQPCSEIEVHYVLAGTMYLSVPGRPAIACGPGSVVLVPPNLARQISADPGPANEVIAFERCLGAENSLLCFDAAENQVGDLRFACGTISANISGSFGLLDTVRHPIAEDLSDEPAVSAALSLMLAEIDRPGLGSRALAGALMKACLLVLLRRHFGRSKHETSLLSTLRDPRLGKAVTAVLDCPSARHSVAALASVAGMSRSAFAREFSQAFAMSPMEFVAKTRLHHAAELLRSTTMPVKVIAANIGFSSRSHFSRAFRDGYGADPSTYRRDSVLQLPAKAPKFVPPARANGAGPAFFAMA